MEFLLYLQLHSLRECESAENQICQQAGYYRECKSNSQAYGGESPAHYADFYDLKHLLILGRVTSGNGGNLILDGANEVLEAEFPELAARMNIQLPDEKSRRVGQSIAAASLPAI